MPHRLITALMCTILVTLAGGQVPTDNLVAFYPFNGDADDASGNGHDGVLYGPVPTFDRFGNATSAYRFDGSNDYISISSFPLLTADFSYCAWVKFLGGHGISTFGINGPDPGHTWNFTYDPGRDRWDMWDNSNSSWYTRDDIDSAWTFVVVVYDGDTQYLYVDGVLLNSRSVRTPISSRSGRSLWLGSAGTWQFLNGIIDDIRVYRRALNQSEIRALYTENGWFASTPEMIPVPSPSHETRPAFKWHALEEGTLYTLQVDTIGDFRSPFISLALTDTAFTPGVALPYGTAHWRVKAGYGRFANAQSFKILDPRVPILIPYVPEVTQERRPLLRWQPVDGASSYTIQVSDTRDFHSPVVSLPITDTSYQPGADLPCGPIYWRVKSVLVDTWSSIDSITILPDSIPSLIRYDGDTVTTRRPEFTWHPVQDAATYRIEIADNWTFTSSTVVPLSDTMFTPLADLDKGKWYWRVSCDRNYSLFSPLDSVVVDDTTPVTETDSRKPASAAVRLLPGGELLLGAAVSGTVRLTLVDAAGRCAWKATRMPAGSAERSVMLPHTAAVSAGVYLLTVTWDGGHVSRKVLLGEAAGR